MRKAEGRNIESKYDGPITGGPAPARSVTVRRSGPRAGNGPGNPLLQRLRRLAGLQKKECLFLTNKATMLLQTKDRKNKQSQTKPIFPGGNPLPAASPEGSAKVPCFLWANPKCRRVRGQVRARRYALRNLSKAHRACSQTTESGCWLNCSSRGMKRRSPEFPRTTQRLHNPRGRRLSAAFAVNEPRTYPSGPRYTRRKIEVEFHNKLIFGGRVG